MSLFDAIWSDPYLSPIRAISRSPRGCKVLGFGIVRSVVLTRVHEKARVHHPSWRRGDDTAQRRWRGGAFPEPPDPAHRAVSAGGRHRRHRPGTRPEPAREAGPAGRD